MLRRHVLLTASAWAIAASALIPACLFEVPATVARGDASPVDGALGPDVVMVDEGGAPIDGGDADVAIGPNGCPVGMVRGTGSCIDAREASGKEYYDFVRASVAAGRTASHPRCSFVTTWEPSNVGGKIEEDDRPVINVSWCQAWEYCKARGKRLCGARGATMTPQDLAQPGRDEWYDACTSGDGRTYAYGSTFSQGACNAPSPATGNDDRENVGTRATCEGGLPGLFDMSGNVSEWSDLCKDVDGGDGRNDECSYHSGGYKPYTNLPAEQMTRCDWSDRVGRDGQNRLVGFRCCATPQ